MDAIAADLPHYLQLSRDSLLRALNDLSEHDARRPVMSSGTNLLGLVKHLAGIESLYLGDCLGRPAPFRLPWVDDGSIWDSADMWATADQFREYIVDLYRAAWAHTDEAIAPGGPRSDDRRSSGTCLPALSPRRRSMPGTPPLSARPLTAAVALTATTAATPRGGTGISDRFGRRPTSSDESG